MALSVNEAIDAAGRLGEAEVRISGTLQLRHEAQALMHFPTSEWRRTGPTPWRSAIWLDLDACPPMRERARALNDREVVVTGRLAGFDPPKPAFGHLSMYAAELTVREIVAADDVTSGGA